MKPEERTALVQDTVEFLRKMGDAHSSPTRRQEMYDRAQAIEDLEAANTQLRDSGAIKDSMARHVIGEQLRPRLEAAESQVSELLAIARAAQDVSKWTIAYIRRYGNDEELHEAAALNQAIDDLSPDVQKMLEEQ